MRNLKRALSLTLASIMLLGMMVVGSSAASYKDVTDDHNVEAIEVLQAVGIMVGDDGNFNPEKNVTRNEMAVIMSNLMDYRTASYAGTSPFTDVPSWAEPYVAACYTNGITSGTSATTYNGNGNVTTSQAALMIMKALGYFQFASDFKDDWQLAATRQANKIDLLDGVKAGVKEAMTRNDVAQLVLNGLEAGTVEADTSSSVNVTVGEANVSVGDTKYNFITSGRDYAFAINSKLDTSNNGQYSAGAIVELGEKLYSGDLTKEGVGDAMGRPSTVWEYKTKEIGTYADEADHTWNASVTSKTLYNAVGKAAADNYSWTVYVDGVSQDYDGRKLNANKTDDDKCFLEKAGVIPATGCTGNGAVTQVYVNSTMADTSTLDKNDQGGRTVTVVVTHYYAAEIYKVNSDVKTIQLSGFYGPVKTTDDFTAEGFEEDEVVMYSFSRATNAIDEVYPAERMEGNVTQVRSNTDTGVENNGDNFIVDDVTYKYNMTMLAKDRLLIENVNNDMVGYKDRYGFVAYIDESAVTYDYAYVLSMGTDRDNYGNDNYGNGSGNSRGTTVYARLVLTDGTIAKVTTNVKVSDADKNYIDLAGEPVGTINIDDAITKFLHHVVSYNKGSDGIYSLSLKDVPVDRRNTGGTGLVGTGDQYYNGAAPVAFTSGTVKAADLEIKNGVAGFHFNKTGEAPTWYTANSNTVFVVADSDANSYDDYSFTVYQGIKNVPDITESVGKDTKIDVATNGAGIAKVVYIQDAEVSGLKDVVFIRANTAAKIVGSVNNSNYYELSAFIDGKGTTLKVKEGSSADHKLVDDFFTLTAGITEAMQVNNANTQFMVAANNIVTDADGLVTNVSLYSPYTSTNGNGVRQYSEKIPVAAQTDSAKSYVGTDRQVADVVYFGTSQAQGGQWWGHAYTEDTAVAWYDYKGSFIDNNTINVIKTDPNNRALVVLDGNTMIGVCIQEVEDGAISGPITTTGNAPGFYLNPNGSATIRYYGDKTAAQLDTLVRTEMARQAGVAVRFYNAVSGQVIFEDGSAMVVTTQQVYLVTAGTTSTYVDKGAVTATGLANGDYLIGTGSVQGVNATHCRVAGGSVTLSPVYADTTLNRAYKVDFDNVTIANVASSGLYVVDGTSLTVTSTATVAAGATLALTDGGVVVATKSNSGSSPAVVSWNYVVNGKDADLDVDNTLYTVKLDGIVVGTVAAGTGVNLPSSKNYFAGKADGTTKAGTKLTVTPAAGGDVIYVVNSSEDTADSDASDKVINLWSGAEVTFGSDVTVTGATSGQVVKYGTDLTVGAAGAATGMRPTAKVNGASTASWTGAAKTGNTYTVPADAKTVAFGSVLSPASLPNPANVTTTDTATDLLKNGTTGAFSGDDLTDPQKVKINGSEIEIEQGIDMSSNSGKKIGGTTVADWFPGSTADKLVVLKFMAPDGITGTSVAVKVITAGAPNGNTGTSDNSSGTPFVLVPYTYSSSQSGQTSNITIVWKYGTADEVTCEYTAKLP